MGNGIYRRPLWSCMKKVFGCTWKKHNRTAQVSTSLSVAAMLPHPSMNDTPSHFEQNAVLPHPVHVFHVLIFHFRKQIISSRMYGVIAEGFDHSLDHLDTWKPFAFSHTNKCLLATDSLRHLVRWGNTMLPHQVPYRDNDDDDDDDSNDDNSNDDDDDDNANNNDNGCNYNNNDNDNDNKDKNIMVMMMIMMMIKTIIIIMIIITTTITITITITITMKGNRRLRTCQYLS